MLRAACAEYFPKKAKAAKKANATAAGQGRSAPTPAQEMPAEEKAAEAKAQEKESERKEAEAKGAEKKSKKGKGKQRKDASDGMDVDLLLHTLKEIQVHGQDHEYIVHSQSLYKGWFMEEDPEEITKHGAIAPHADMNMELIGTLEAEAHLTDPAVGVTLHLDPIAAVYEAAKCSHRGGIRCSIIQCNLTKIEGPLVDLSNLESAGRNGLQQHDVLLDFSSRSVVKVQAVPSSAFTGVILTVDRVKPAGKKILLIRGNDYTATHFGDYRRWREQFEVEFDPDTDCGGREPPKALKELRTHEVFAPADGGQEDERPKRHRPERNWASVLNARNQSGPAKSLLK